LLTRTGLSLPTVDVDDIEVQYGDGVGLVEHLRMMGEGGGLMLQRREALRRDTALASAAIYQTMFSSDNNGNGEGSPPSSSSPSSSSSSVVGTYQVIYMTGWSPDPSQPKAAKRGSATVNFQDLSKDLGGG
jgi:NADH dehydrogenase [ubiquinone] 1 alpha subcomplex assembly factor 5